MHRSSVVIRVAMVSALNQELARSYQAINDIRAIIAPLAKCGMLRDPACVRLARELERRASEELNHARLIVEQIDHLTMAPPGFAILTVTTRGLMRLDERVARHRAPNAGRLRFPNVD